MEKQDLPRIFYSLREMRVKPILPAHINMIKGILAARQNGFNVVTIDLIRSIFDIKINKNMTGFSTLHNLGDKKVLTYLKDDRKHKNIRWVLSGEFLKIYNREE